MKAEKLFSSSTKHYKISLESDNQKYIPPNLKQLGRLRSNLPGTHFYIYDDGLNPKDATQQKLD